MPLQFIATLPFRSQDRYDPQANLDVSVWRSVENLCEMQVSGACDSAAGIYYGSREDNVTKFCPRHFYDAHFSPTALYVLVDPS